MRFEAGHNPVSPVTRQKYATIESTNQISCIDFVSIAADCVRRYVDRPAGARRQSPWFPPV